MAEGETRGDRADDHEHERHAVDLFSAHLVAEPPEEELTGEGADEGDAVDCRGDVGGERAGPLWIVFEVVDAAQELSDKGDAEEVVGVGEEAHPGDDYGGEVV